MSTILDQLGDAVREVSQSVGPSVVAVAGERSGGSGVVVGEGLVLTNAHNVRGDETEVTFVGGRHAAATLAGIDVDGDLAVLRVDTADVPAVRWAATGPQAGDLVVSLANPSGSDPRVSLGTVSTSSRAFRGPSGRRLEGFEHTAPLPRASSGGPVLDGSGALVGLNTHRVRGGFYLAVPASEELRKRVEALGRGESRPRLRLGVGLAPSEAARRLRRAVGLPQRDGLLVRAVVDDSPAGRAGLGEGDLIVAVGGTPVVTVDDLHSALDSVDPAGSVVVRVVRGTEELELTVSFA